MALQPSPTIVRAPTPIASCDAGQVEVFNHYDENGSMWSGNGERVATRQITFDTPFLGIPTIQVSLVGIDATHEQNLRFHLRAADATKEGFTVEMMTWNDTRIARATASWIAFGMRDAAAK